MMSTHTLTIDDLERRVLSGAHWRVADISSEHAVVDMRTCTGERMKRVESDDPAVIGHLRTAHPELDERGDEALALDSSGAVDRMGVPPCLDEHGPPPPHSGYCGRVSGHGVRRAHQANL
jgi:hypothetical protein